MYDYLQITDNEGKNKAIKNPKKDPEYFGEPYTEKADGNVRIWFTNPCGIGIRHDDIKSYDSIRFLSQKSRCDIFGLAETNVNWHRLKGSSTFYSRIKRSWKTFRTVTCHNTLEDLGISQRGGNCMAVVGQVAFRMVSSGKDGRNLGRWAWMEFSGRDSYTTRVYTAYRPGSHKSPQSKNTTVYDQQDRYIRSKNIIKTPRELFDQDIQEEILEQLGNKNIILMLDVNEDVEQGTFNKMMNGIGMRNGLQSRLYKPMPATHHRGSRPISAIYCSRNMKVTRAGILPIGTGVRGDHKNMFVDIQTTSFIGGKMYMVAPPPMRTLKMNDSRVYLRFIKLVKKHLTSNKLSEKAKDLYDNGAYPADISMIREMEVIDEQMGRAIKHGLKKCRKIYSGSIPFSALFNTLSRKNRLWLLIMKKKKGQRISNTTIRRLSKQVGITNPMQTPMDEVIHQLRSSKKQYESFIPHAPTERQRFYEDLASANAANSNQKKLTILKNIMQTESSRQQHAVIRSVFPKKASTSKKVDRVQVLQGDKWEEITTPTALVAALQKENKEKYSCTNGTPLMKKDIHRQMGNFAEGRLSKEIQHGHVDPTKFFDIWTSKMLSQSVHDPNIPRIPIEIKMDELEDAWRVSKENKAASPSGRYNATYKAMCKDEELLKMITTHINIPFKLGHPYQRWSTFLDIMAFKKAHSTQINTLRSIIISEGDWNVAGRIYVTRKMMKQAEHLNLLPEEHLGGRKGKKSIDGAITKRLFLDNSRILKRPTVVLSTDAANCYDRMVHKFICMMCKKWGLEEQVLRALLKPLQNAKHFTRTAFGDSPSFFTGDNLQGAGQGNTSAAPFWTCVSSPMIALMKEFGSQAKMTSPMSLEEITLTLLSFVDDTEMFLMIEDDDIQKLLNLAHTTLQNWKSVLQATGGDMRSQKCAWILIQYGKRQRTYDSFNMSLKDGDGITRDIKKYEKEDPREYLGVLQQANGEDTAQLEALEGKVEKWNKMMEKSKLYNTYNCSAVFTRIQKSIQYPLPATAMSETDLQKLSDKLYEKCLPKCGINRKFPIVHRDLPFQYQGLSLPNLYFQQESTKLIEVLSSNNTNHILWKQYKLGLEILQLHTGVMRCVLNYDHSKYSTYIDSTWITSQWKFMSENNIKIKGWESNIEKQRQNDESLMSVFIRKGYSGDNLRTLNRCRMYLNAVLLSDVVDGDGTSLCPMAMEGRKDKGRLSKLHWQEQKKPPCTAWFKWREALRNSLCISSENSTLISPLGKWTEHTHNTWKWLFDESTQMLYNIVDGHCRVYRASSRRKMNLRIQLRLFKAIRIIPIEKIPKACIRASAEFENNGYLYVKYYGSAQQTRCHQQKEQRSIGALQFNNDQEWIYATSNLGKISRETMDSIMEEPVRVVADGSYKDEHSSMAVIIETISQNTQIVAIGPVPANKTSPTHVTDPYRSEMAGLYAGLSIMKKIEETTNKRTDIILSCDNDSALRVATSYTTFNARMRHYDMARALIQKRRNMSSSITAKRVLGHADAKIKNRKFTRTEILNQACDRLAKTARKSFSPIGNRKLDDEGLSIWHNGEKINHDIKTHLQQIFFHRKAALTFNEKYGWKNDEFNHIDWDANSKAMSMMTYQTRIWIAKRITKFLPIGRNMERMNKWTMSYCPRCCKEEETHDHLLQCQHIPSFDLLQVNLSKMRDWLVRMRTPEILEKQLMALISKYLNLPSTIIMLPHWTISDQNTIGTWEHFMQGRIHVSFAKYMAKTYADLGETKKTGKSWTAGLIQRIWTLIHRPIWDLRNQYVHQKINESKTTRMREDLINRVEEKYHDVNSATLLARDRHLLSEPLQMLIQSSDTNLRAWLIAMKVACSERDKAGENDRMHANTTLGKWMIRKTPHNNRRGSNGGISKNPKKKRVNAKPRRQLQHRFIRTAEWGNVSAAFLHRTGFYKPP